MHHTRVRNPVIRLLTVLLLAGFVGACTGETGEGDSPTSPGTQSTAELEYQSFELANDARRGRNVKPMLKYRDALSDVARAHSRSMRENNFFSHTGTNGDRLVHRLNDAGIQYTAAAENIVRFTSSGSPADVAHDILMGSQGHRNNILNSSYNRMGVGVSRKGDEYWITQIFIKP